MSNSPSVLATETGAGTNVAHSDAAQERADQRADRRHALVIRSGQIGVGVVFLLAWELASGRVFDEFFVSKPSLIAGRILELALDGELWATSG